MKKLTKKEVAEIKQHLIDNEMSNAEIAAQYGVRRGVISDIKNDRAHKDVPWPNAKPLDPTDERVKELEAEVTHLRDERNLYKRQAKAVAMENGIFQALTEVIEDKVKPFPALPSQSKVYDGSEIEEDLVLHLSDGHHDQVVTLEETGGLEQYDFPISCARAERLVDTVIEHSQCHLPNYRFRKLWILANGDNTSGEIHDGEKRTYFRNTMKSCLAIGQLHALMIRDLAPHFESIQCVYLSGNHGRRTPKKDHHGANENWDYLIGKIAEVWLRDVQNVNFLIPNAYSVNLVIQGHGMNLSHGDDVRGSLGLPWYGMVRKQKNLMALNNVTGGTPIKYFAIGHHHIQASLADLNGELLANGAWLGCDAYSYNSFSGYRAPTQLLHGMHKKHGVTWRMPVNLKHDGETKGPRRYKVTI